MNMQPKYVLVTPTKDEEKNIGETIRSVVEQIHLPSEWIIISDGSTDRTNEIIARAQIEHDWIKLIKLPPRKSRCFGAVARATKQAMEHLSVDDFEFIGLLDSDLRFQPDYFERVLVAFAMNDKLGIAGGRVLDPGDDSRTIPDNLQDVPGAAQFFRRDCFESLSDIHAIPEGGWDMLTCTEARMNGYETRLLSDLVIDHLKPRNIAYGGLLKRLWQCGVRDYVLGYHPLFETVKCVRRLRQRPVVISAVSWWLGYVVSSLRRRKRIVPQELLLYIRGEQIRRLSSLFKGQ